MKPNKLPIFWIFKKIYVKYLYSVWTVLAQIFIISVLGAEVNNIFIWFLWVNENWILDYLRDREFFFLVYSRFHVFRSLTQSHSPRNSWMSGTTHSSVSLQRYIVSASTSPNQTCSEGVKFSPDNSSMATSPPPFIFNEFTIGTGVTGDLKHWKTNTKTTYYIGSDRFFSIEIDSSKSVTRKFD